MVKYTSKINKFNLLVELIKTSVVQMMRYHLASEAKQKVRVAINATCMLAGLQLQLFID